MIHFDDVLTVACNVLTASPAASFVQEVLVLRDLRGRIRLFLKPQDDHESDVAGALADLGQRLASGLGPFWGNVIELDSPRSSFEPLLNTVRSERHPLEPQTQFPNWWIIERHAAKSAWTDATHRPPWPARRQTPCIVAFFSHKGGVGRTTALCSAAVNLARGGDRVAVVDLDLEAPGLGTLLSHAPVAYGVTDYLLERLLAGSGYKPNLHDFAVRQVDPQLIGEGGEPILCVPAGTVNEYYLEKLARLDYELLANYAEESDSPLGNLLSHVKTEWKPKYIFLDCRAGLHDLGGLAVHRLSHANVVFGLDSEQSWQGLRCLLRTLGQVQEPPPCLLVQAMESSTPDARRQEARDRFLTKAYEAFCATYYDEDDVPDIASEDEAHSPFHLPYLQPLSGYQNLQDIAELLMREPFVEFVQHLKDLAAKTQADGT
jgi:cellulose biosynthesis protein BcsQ